MRLSRLLAAAAAPALMLGALAAPSYADDISNNLDASIDTAAEIMPLNVGGANGTTTLYVQPTGGDGKGGCNLTGSTTLVVSVASSNTAVATVSPSSVTFDSCGATRILTVTPVSTGTSTVSVAQTSNNSGGTFNFAPATFTVNVAPPANTAPTVTVTGVTGGTDYPQGSVPAAICQVTDAEDGPSSFAATLSGVDGPHSAVGIGAQEASCSYTDAGGLTATSSVTYNIVPVPNTAPTVTVNGVTDGVSYELGSVPPATCDVTDAEDVDPSADPVVEGVTGPHAALGIGSQTVTCSFTDGGDITGQNELSDSDSVTYNIVPVPNTAPSVTVSGVTDGESYDKGDVPAAMCDMVDAEDGNSSFAADLSAITGPYASDGIGSQTATCERTDSGNIIGEDRLDAKASATYSIADPTAPGIDATVTPAAPDGDNDWYVSDVSVDWTVTESESPNSLSKTGCVDVDITSDQAEESYSCSASSAGGNSGPMTVDIKRDATAPTLNVTGGPADGGSYFWGSVPAEPTCSSSDATSGLAGACAVSGWSSAVGTHTVTVSVKDNAGNETSVSRTYTVKSWTTKGFFAPVDMGGVYNTVKGGSTVPLKFELFAGSTELTETSAVKSFTTQLINCDGSAPQDAVEITTTGGTSLRYDSTAGQFIQNWKTPTNAGKCYQATMTAQDASTISALFKLK